MRLATSTLLVRDTSVASLTVTTFSSAPSGHRPADDAGQVVVALAGEGAVPADRMA